MSTWGQVERRVKMYFQTLRRQTAPKENPKASVSLWLSEIIFINEFIQYWLISLLVKYQFSWAILLKVIQIYYFHRKLHCSGLGQCNLLISCLGQWIRDFRKSWLRRHMSKNEDHSKNMAHVPTLFQDGWFNERCPVWQSLKSMYQESYHEIIMFLWSLKFPRCSPKELFSDV